VVSQKKCEDLEGDGIFDNGGEVIEKEDEINNKMENEVVQESNKSAPVPPVSKGRGVSNGKKDRARVKDIGDSANVDPFLTVCLSCVSTKKERADSWPNANCSADADEW
jgi:hypothetical protein